MNNYFRMSAIAVVLSLGSQMAVAAQDADDFVEDASAKGIAEVQVGKLAQDEKGVSADVKEFAKQMVTDHTAANEKLAAIAKSKNLEVSEDPMLMDKAKAMILEMREKSFDQRTPTIRSPHMSRRSSCTRKRPRMARIQS